MAIGSISSNAVSTGTADTRFAGPKAREAAERPEPTIADHVAAVDDQAPIRSGSTTQGTLVDTYL
jgi:hypothetical protein